MLHGRNSKHPDRDRVQSESSPLKRRALLSERISAPKNGHSSPVCIDSGRIGFPLFSSAALSSQRMEPFRPKHSTFPTSPRIALVLVLRCDSLSSGAPPIFVPRFKSGFHRTQPKESSCASSESPADCWIGDSQLGFSRHHWFWGFLFPTLQRRPKPHR